MSVVRRLPVVADLTLVTAGAMTANVAGYLLQLLASRWLGVSGYGSFASLLAVQTLCAVPALALQNVVAREVVRGAPAAAARRLAYRCAGLVAVAAVVLAPLVSAVLKVGIAAAAGALAAAPILVLLAGEQGILQGRSRFRDLALVLAGGMIARVTPALLVLAGGGGPSTALWTGAAGATAAVLIVRRLDDTAWAGRSRERATESNGPGAQPHSTDALPGVDGETLYPLPVVDPEDLERSRSRPSEGSAAQAPAGNRNAGGRPDRHWSGLGVLPVFRAVQVQAALMALSSADLIVSRIVLDENDAGRYALGAIATKIAFWLPQAVGVVLYPRMAQPQHSARAMRSALAVLVGIGALAVAGAAIAAPLAPLFAGHDYAPIEGLLWLFALEGALLSVLQGALLSAIATDRTAPAAITWLGLAAGVAAMLTLVHSVLALIVTATITAAATTLVITVLALRTARADPEPDAAVARFESGDTRRG